jgi:hypothetical protein
MSYKSPEKVLLDVLVTATAVTSVVGTRIYPLLAPASSALPFVTWRRTGIERTQTLGSPHGVPRVSVDYTVVAATYNQAREAADAMRRTLDGYGGTVDNTEVKQTALIDEADDLVEVEGAESPLYVVKQTYDIWWQET